MEYKVSPPASLGFWHPATLIATFGGVGLLRPAPGTLGSLVALPIAWSVVSSFGASGLVWLTLLLFAAGVWAATQMEKASNTKDPSSVVVDEVVGQWIVVAVMPLSLTWYLVAFGLFRLFDIWKPWPVSVADQDLKGGFGVMADDVLAGLYALLVSLVLLMVF